MRQRIPGAARQIRESSNVRKAALGVITRNGFAAVAVRIGRDLALSVRYEGIPITARQSVENAR
jgi:hypothetical protein